MRAPRPAPAPRARVSLGVAIRVSPTPSITVRTVRFYPKPLKAGGALRLGARGSRRANSAARRPPVASARTSLSTASTVTPQLESATASSALLSSPPGSAISACSRAASRWRVLPVPRRRRRCAPAATLGGTAHHTQTSSNGVGGGVAAPATPSATPFWPPKRARLAWHPQASAPRAPHGQDTSCSRARSRRSVGS